MSTPALAAYRGPRPHSVAHAAGPKTPNPAHNHDACERLTGIVLERAPTDGSPGRQRSFRNGAIIWETHDPANSLFFLLRGQVIIQFSDIEGRETTLRRIEPRQPFGELCFCSQRRGNIAKAAVQSQALEISYAEFLDFIAHDRAVLHALVYAFCERLSNAEVRIGVLAHRGVEQRLGALLLELAKARSAPGADPTDVIIRLSHEELAQMAAMSRSHVTVTMGRLRDLGLIRYTRDQPVRVNIPALARYLKQPLETG